MPKGPVPNISVVVPMYQEEAHAAGFLKELTDTLKSLASSFEVIVIDDGSTDDTWSAAVAASKEYRTITAARLSRNFGKEVAIAAGLEIARGDAVIVMDGDGQHPTSLIPEMVSKWRDSGCDIVEAEKTSRGEESVGSKISAGLFYLIWNKLSGFELRGASDFKLLSRRAVDAYLQMPERTVFFRGMTAWLGFERVRIPFEVAPRMSGRSGWPLIKRLRLAIDGISGFTSLPLHLITFAGILFLVFSIVLGIYTLALQLAGRSVSGFATVILLLLIIGSFLMISLGIIGIYLARIYDELKRRPRYVIAQRIDADPSAVSR